MWRILAVLALTCGIAQAQPTPSYWRPPGPCTNGQVIQWSSSLSRWTCGTVAALSGLTTNRVLKAGSSSTAVNTAFPIDDAAGTLTLGDNDGDIGTTRGIWTVQTTGADSSPLLRLTNDVATWQIGTDGAVSDTFHITEMGVATWLRLAKATGLATITGGVTTPANLTTTGTGSVVSNNDVTAADDLFVTDDSTIGDDSTDRVGLGVAPDTNHPLTLAAAVGNKIALFPINSTTAYGFGVQASTLQYYTDASGGVHSFGYGDSDAFTASCTIANSTQSMNCVGGLLENNVAVLSGAITDNVIPMGTATGNLEDSALADDGTYVNTARRGWFSKDINSFLQVGYAYSNTTNAQNNITLLTDGGDGNAYILAKAASTKGLVFQVGQGTEAATTRTWLTVTGSNGNTAFSGSLTSGDAAGDIFDHNGDVAKLNGNTQGDGSMYVKDQSINCLYAVDSDNTCYINYYGYNGAGTRKRSLIVSDGTATGNPIATFSGIDKSVAVVGNLSTNGHLTSGDGAGDIFDHNGSLAIFGSVHGVTYINENTINGGYSADNDVADLWLNYYGYAGGTTRFRTLNIGDGKGATVASFTGNGKTADFNGDLTKFGSTDGYTYIDGAGLNFEYSANATATGYINYKSYQNGVTQFRQLAVMNGKGAQVAMFDGTNGNVGIGTDTTPDYLLDVQGTLNADTSLNVGGVILLSDASTSIGSTAIQIGNDSSDTTELIGIINATNAATRLTVGDFRGTVLAPSAITGTVNNWAPTNHASAATIVVSTSGAATITGLAGGANGRRVDLCNYASHNITIANNSGSSSAANRILLADSFDRNLLINGAACLRLEYRTSDNLWHEIGTNEFSRAYVSTDLVLYSDAHIVSAIGATGPVLSSCGTSPTVQGSDTAGIITVGGGTAATCTLTFATAYTTNAPSCIVVSESSARTDLYFSAKSTSAMTIANTAGANMASVKLNYHCIGTTIGAYAEGL